MRYLFEFILIVILISGCTSTPRYLIQEENSQSQPAVDNSDSNNSVDTVKNDQDKEIHEVETGIASFTADELQGERTASGEMYNLRALTAAHRTLPFGTLVKVTNVANGKSVVVRINDRGPNVPDRIIDVTFEAAKRLGFIEEGKALVEIEVVKNK